MQILHDKHFWKNQNHHHYSQLKRQKLKTRFPFFPLKFQNPRLQILNFSNSKEFQPALYAVHLWIQQRFHHHITKYATKQVLFKVVFSLQAYQLFVTCHLSKNHRNSPLKHAWKFNTFGLFQTRRWECLSNSSFLYARVSLLIATVAEAHGERRSLLDRVVVGSLGFIDQNYKLK